MLMGQHNQDRQKPCSETGKLWGSGSSKQIQPHGGHQHRAPLVSFIERSSLGLFHLALYSFITELELIFATQADGAHPAWGSGRRVWRRLLGPPM